MVTNYKYLPPLDHLLAFEAAAYFESFAAASRILNISESAISRKTRLVELHFGVPLFLRGHKSISLTPHGRRLLDRISPAMQNLRDASNDLMSRQNRNEVSLAATNSVAALWLMPRLRKFNTRNKQLKIMLFASDSDAECLGESNDLAILRGEGNWPGYKSKLLFGENIFPICSPAFLNRQPRAGDLAELPQLPLIDVSSDHTEWMNWETWFTGQGVQADHHDGVVTFNTYPLAVQAAVDGLGIALGWGHLVDHLLETGALIRPVKSCQTRTTSGYYLLRPEKQRTFPERRVVEDWLLKESAARKRYG